jgi:hypothetical protein
MLDFTNTTINAVAVHFVGNQLQDEELKLSDGTTQINDIEVLNLLQKYFLSAFKSEQLYNLHHESGIENNVVFNAVSEIFDNNSQLFDQSKSLAEYLYNVTEHPNIKSGEFYVVHFADCVLNDEITDAIGIFKSESKERFLRVKSGKSIDILAEEGISVNKLDKGALIYNTDKDNGYVLAVVDNVSRGAEAQYWKDTFLGVRNRVDNYHFTSNYINVCKSFVTGKLPEEFRVTKADQVEMLNKTVEYFKEQDNFDLGTFRNEVFKQQPEVIKAFDEYKVEYEEQHEVKLADEFAISAPAVKKEGKQLKSVIKLDKSFHIYVHGNKKNLVRGYDQESGMHYYQLFFKEES